MRRHLSMSAEGLDARCSPDASGSECPLAALIAADTRKSYAQNGRWPAVPKRHRQPRHVRLPTGA